MAHIQLARGKNSLQNSYSGLSVDRLLLITVIHLQDRMSIVLNRGHGHPWMDLSYLETSAEAVIGIYCQPVLCIY